MPDSDKLFQFYTDANERKIQPAPSPALMVTRFSPFSPVGCSKTSHERRPCYSELLCVRGPRRLCGAFLSRSCLMTVWFLDYCSTPSRSNAFERSLLFFQTDFQRMFSASELSAMGRWAFFFFQEFSPFCKVVCFRDIQLCSCAGWRMATKHRRTLRNCRFRGWVTSAPSGSQKVFVLSG